MKMEISYKYLQLIKTALDTQIRLLSAYINKTYDQLVEIEAYKKVAFDIGKLIEQRDNDDE